MPLTPYQSQFNAYALASRQDADGGEFNCEVQRV